MAGHCIVHRAIRMNDHFEIIRKMLLVLSDIEVRIHTVFVFHMIPFCVRPVTPDKWRLGSGCCNKEFLLQWNVSSGTLVRCLYSPGLTGLTLCYTLVGLV